MIAAARTGSASGTCGRKAEASVAESSEGEGNAAIHLRPHPDREVGLQGRAVLHAALGGEDAVDADRVVAFAFPLEEAGTVPYLCLLVAGHADGRLRRPATPGSIA